MLTHGTKWWVGATLDPPYKEILMSINWSRFVEVINEHENFLLTSHIRPDCDALGSELGMAGVLEAIGKRVRIVNGNLSNTKLSPRKSMRMPAPSANSPLRMSVASTF